MSRGSWKREHAPPQLFKGPSVTRTTRAGGRDPAARVKRCRVPARDDPGSKRTTRLAAVRHWRGATQQELAEAVGVSLNTIRRLESGQVANPPLRTLINCSKALGVRLGDVAEPEWTTWWVPEGLDARSLPEPPDGGWRKRWRPRASRPGWVPPDSDD
jgi:transcriptional regulator with XRE-family HTH domain